MKKLLLPALFMLCVTGVFAQGKIMVGASGRFFGPACTNCTALYGGSISGAYAVINKLAVGLDLGLYSRSETSTLSALAIGITGDFYPKGDFKGFYVGPDITLINLTNKFGSSKVSDSNITIGANIGWAIAIGEKLRIIPHLGYGTWFEDSKGRITTGLKVGFRI